MLARLRIRPLALAAALGTMLTVFLLPGGQLAPVAPQVAAAAVPSPTPTSTPGLEATTPSATMPPVQAREATVADLAPAAAQIAALVTALEGMSPEEQQRLATASDLASTLAPVERQVELALPEVGVQDVVLLHRLFVPGLMRFEVPLPATPTPTATRPPVTATPTPTRTPRPDPNGGSAEVSVRLWAKPSVRVARGDLLAIDIELSNRGDDASRIVLRLPYDKKLVSVSNSDLSSKDWVSAIEDKYVEVTFGELRGGKTRSGTIFFRIKSNLADNTVIETRGSAVWDDGDDGGTTTSNWAPVLVGGGNDNSDWAWMQVSPESATAGTTFKFFTDRFIPGEEVVFWLNTPDGVRALDMPEEADSRGRIWAELGTRGEKAGYYSLVAHGLRSEIEAVRSFQIR